MNAPNQRPPLRLLPRPFPERIKTLMPECTDFDEAEMRERLLMARDIATRELAREWQNPGAQLFLTISDIAGAWAFANVSIEQLTEARGICVELMRLISLIQGLCDGNG